MAARQVNFLKDALARADLLRLRKGSDLPPVFLSVPGLLIIANVLLVSRPSRKTKQSRRERKYNSSALWISFLSKVHRKKPLGYTRAIKNISFCLSVDLEVPKISYQSFSPLYN